MKKIIYLGLLLSFLSSPALAATNASSAIIRLYKAYMSTSGDCSSPEVFFDAASDPTTYPNGYAEVDMVNNPTIGSGSLTGGTYQCVIFKMSDQITFTAADDEGAQCVQDQTYTTDVCWNWNDNVVIKNPETNEETLCTTMGEPAETIWVYISTWSTLLTGSGCEDCDGFIPPTTDGDTKNGYKLTNAVDLGSNIIGTFVFGTDGKVVTEQSGGLERCGLETPDFSFRVEAQ
ncbi:MAG: hypothetical protein ABH859_03310 [Pseudomonadota bacterium]